MTERIDGVRLEQHRLESAALADHGYPITGWTDPKSDHTLVRLQIGNSSNTTQSLFATTFAADAATGLFLPTRWSATITRANGEVVSVRENYVTSIRVNHAPIASEFDLTFPLGASVADLRDGNEYLAGESGELRPKRRPEPLPPDPPQKPRTAPVGVAVVAGVAAGLVGLLWYARSRTKPASH